MSSDGMPIIGRTPSDDRVIVATGHGALGITLAPSTAELVATLAGGKELEQWLDALGAGRFRRLGWSVTREV
jgi:D-amino-acid dehydrogenase